MTERNSVFKGKEGNKAVYDIEMPKEKGLVEFKKQPDRQLFSQGGMRPPKLNDMTDMSELT